MSLSLAKFFAAYGSYHNNVVNKTIHIFCVPLIFLTLVAIITNYSPHIDVLHLGKQFELNFSMLLVLLVSAVYMYVDLVSGIVSSTIYIGLVILTNHWYHEFHGTPTYDTYMRVMIAIHVVGWLSQFVGHGIFEKRAPALLDNILQVFVAPNFVVIEVLFMLGYRPEAHKEAQKMINQNIAEFRASKAKKST